MRVYQFADKEYTSLTALCRAHDELVLPPDADVELLAATGITLAERPDPEPTPEEALAQAKALRAAAVAAIVVEVDGLPFNGDEDAQRRMNNALTVGDLSGQSSTPWVLADNSVREVSRAQLEKALVLSVQRMSELWMLPYTETAAGQEPGQDVETEVGQDAETESGQDVETDAGQDTETAAGQDAGQDAETAAGQDAETESGQDAETEAGQDVETEPGQDVGQDVGQDAGQDVETDAGAQVSEAVAAEGGHAG